MKNKNFTQIVKAIVLRVYPIKNSLFFMQRLVLKPKNRELITVYLTRMFSKLAISKKLTENKISAALREQGFVMLTPVITTAQINNIKDYLKDKLLFDRFNENVDAFAVDNIPTGTHVAPYYDQDVVNCPHILDIANATAVLEVVTGFLGCKPTISQMGIWWSVGDGGDAQEAEFFHRDVDDWRFVKLFIYLTDVDHQTGPHRFVPGSQNVAKLLPIRRYTDDEIALTFPKETWKEFIGPAGTSFLENTFGFHKGVPVIGGRRLLMQVQYSIFPIWIYKYTPSFLKDFRYDSYINRLFVRGK